MDILDVRVLFPTPCVHPRQVTEELIRNLKNGSGVELRDVITVFLVINVQKLLNSLVESMQEGHGQLTQKTESADLHRPVVAGDCDACDAVGLVLQDLREHASVLRGEVYTPSSTIGNRNSEVDGTIAPAFQCEAGPAEDVLDDRNNAPNKMITGQKVRDDGTTVDNDGFPEEGVI